jgi:glyoxylase-like metal-dependent hydrolase (beta-lactamase superfamily II)
MQIKEVADKIFWFDPVLSSVNIPLNMYFIREPEGVLIEPGPTALAPAIQDAMKHLGMKDLAYIIPTHIHVDNGSGSGRLSQLFSKAKIVAHPQGAKHMVDPSRLIEGTKAVWGNDFESYLGPIIPIPESRLLVAGDGEIITVNGRELQIIYAPGHAPHQIAIFDRKVKGIFCGEALGGVTVHQMPAVAPPSFDLENYVATIDKLRHLKAQILFYSHGDAWKDPERLTSMATEKARMYGDLILDAMKKGKNSKDISLILGDYIVNHFGVTVDEKDLYTTAEGYAIYFKKKGIV